MQPTLARRDRHALDRHHSRQRPRLFADNFPWNDDAFTRRFTLLTDVKRQYWGTADADADRIEALLSATPSFRFHVIDLCCGAGRHAIELARRGIRCTGIDISPYAVRRARGRLAACLPRRQRRVRFLTSDVLTPPDTGNADLIAILCEQIVNFSPAQAAALVAAWSPRLSPGGAMVVESPTELPPASDELFWMDEALFLDAPCWVRHTQQPDTKQRTLLEIFTCLAKPGQKPRSFFNSRKYYTAEDISALAPQCDAQVIEIPACEPRPDLIWVVLRRR